MTDVGLPPAFYHRVGDDVYEATSATESPWDAEAQHGGPPTALCIAAIERELADSGLRVTSVTADFLGTIPKGIVEIHTRIIRSGRRIQLMESTMHFGGQPVVVARCWSIRTDQQQSSPTPDTRLLDPAGEASTAFLPGVSPDWNYGRAIEWRFVRGGYDTPGPVSVWTRTRIPLIEDEPTSGLQRMAIVADSTNGVSWELDPRHWLFIPTSLTISSPRHQQADWLHLDAHTLISGPGAGTAHAQLSDEAGPLGSCSQPMLVQPRG